MLFRSQLGFFNPANADAALAALEMMDFEGVEKVRDRVRSNGTLAQQLAVAQAQLAAFTAQLPQTNQPQTASGGRKALAAALPRPDAAANRGMNLNRK